MTPHPQFGDAYELLALTGEADEAGREIAAHLESGCGECRQQMAQARAMVAALGLLAEPAAPGKAAEAALRRRLRERPAPPVAREPKGAAATRAHWGWGRPFAIALAAAIVLAIITGGLWARLSVAGRRITGLTQERSTAAAQARQATTQVAELRAALALLAAPGTRSVAAKLGPAQPRAQAFINPRRGVVLIGLHMPVLPAAKTYEMWLLPAKGAPRPAGLFRPSARGTAVHLYRGGLAGVAGIAVSIEPAAGSAAPTGPIVMAIPLGHA